MRLMSLINSHLIGNCASIYFGVHCCCCCCLPSLFASLLFLFKRINFLLPSSSEKLLYHLIYSIYCRCCLCLFTHLYFRFTFFLSPPLYCSGSSFSVYSFQLLSFYDFNNAQNFLHDESTGKIENENLN